MIKVLYPGLYTSIQDVGRFGYRNIGVPVSGVMDSISAGIANALLNNKRNDAVLEITMTGPKLEFKTSTDIVISGAEMSAKINNDIILNNKVYSAKSGDVLSFGLLIKGLRCYLAVSGGFQTEIVLKSKSFYNGITRQTFFKKDDIIPIKNMVVEKTQTKGSIITKEHFFETTIIDVFRGPEFNLFSSIDQQKLLINKFTVSNDNNRMGYRLKEELIKHSISIITSPVLPGTVQVMPSGKLIILMKDAQTTGGYPRVFQLTEKSIAILAQKKAGDKINFRLISYL